MLIKIADLQRKLSLSRTAVYDLIRRDPTFPPTIKLGPRVPRWRESEVDAWIASREQPRAA